jgi:hypothetical protein
LNAAVGASLRGRVAIWKSLRLVAEGGMRALSAGMSATIHGDDNRPDTTYTYSRWRPGFAVGIELAM